MLALMASVGTAACGASDGANASRPDAALPGLDAPKGVAPIDAPLADDLRGDVPQGGATAEQAMNEAADAAREASGSDVGAGGEPSEASDASDGLASDANVADVHGDDGGDAHDASEAGDSASCLNCSGAPCCAPFICRTTGNCAGCLGINESCGGAQDCCSRMCGSSGLCL
jgi:hypothetical protein